MRRNSLILGTRACRSTALLLAAGVALLALAGGALAHQDSGDHGSLTIHDRDGGEPQTSSGPFEDPVQVTCQVWIRGYNMTHADGTVEIRQGLELRAKAQTVTAWNGTANGDGGYDVEVGPVTLDAEGELSLWAEMEGHGSQEHDVEYDACETEPVPAPACPPSLDVEVRDDGNVSLAWEAAAHAETYLVQRAEADNFTTIAEVNATTHVDGDIEANTTYDYRVLAANENGTAEDCEIVQVDVPALDVPLCPTGLEVEVAGDLVALTWNATSRAEAYLVLRAEAGHQPEPIAEVEGTTFLDLGVDATAAHAYAVVAASAGSQAEQCPIVETGSSSPDDGPPACPTQLDAEAMASEEVRLTWAAAEDAESYHVYRASGESGFEHVAEVQETSYVDGETEAETTYEYQVTAANTAGKAKACETVEVTAIPVFGEPVYVAVAALGGVGLAAVVHRSR
jgi:fibronectin type 3 domain-containing protein